MEKKKTRMEDPGQLERYDNPGPIFDLVLNRDQLLTVILRLGTFLCLLGWTWVHFYWEGPYAILIWNEATYNAAKNLGIDWEQFVGSGANDGTVQFWLGQIAWLFLLGAVVSWTIWKESIYQILPLLVASFLLGVVFFAKYLAVQRQLPMLIEHGGQFLMPILLILALKLGPRHPVTLNTAIIAVTLTFAGHGAYALGLWPTPANYFAMTKVILGFDREAATIFLFIAGVMDYLLCVGLLIPKLRRVSALYAVAWGLLTALARPVAGMSVDLNFWGADQFIHEAVLRAPHFMIPLYLLVLWHPDSKKTTGTLASGTDSVADS